MGICLDTEQNNEELETTGGELSRRDSVWGGTATPPAAAFPMQNATNVKFEPPNVPVIFVLGGPGSGKVTHCDNLMHSRRGVVHINMTDLLQQYAIGNDMQDFGTLSSKTVTEVLMLEMKMAPTAKTYLVSGYPRSMRDVAEYSDKIQTITGVILVSWRQRVLERQIEYGARLGHVVLNLARMELTNFYKHVMPVADYFDQTNLLIAVNGERNPEEVYKDFKAAVLQILGSQDPSMSVGGIPGEIVGLQPAPLAGGLNRNKTGGREREPMAMPILPIGQQMITDRNATPAPQPEVIRVRGATTNPPIVWVVGGPGSNKLTLCQRAVTHRNGWTHFSLGQRLRALADSGGGPTSDGVLARNAVSAGELVPRELAVKLVRAAVSDVARTGLGIVLDGYPRDLEQMESFEKEFRVEPRMVLLDCSKLQLGRGRRDDSVAAFRRRLEVFRELSLPMLKALDQQQRLVIVDGDTDTTEVQEEFSRVLVEEMEKAEALAAILPPSQPNLLATPPSPPTITERSETMKHFTHAMSRMGNGYANGGLPNGVMPNGLPNGVLANNKVQPLMSNAPKVPTVSQITMSHDDVRRLYDHSSGEMVMDTHM